MPVDALRAPRHSASFCALTRAVAIANSVGSSIYKLALCTHGSQLSQRGDASRTCDVNTSVASHRSACTVDSMSAESLSEAAAASDALLTAMPVLASDGAILVRFIIVL